MQETRRMCAKIGRKYKKEKKKLLRNKYIDEDDYDEWCIYAIDHPT